MSNCGFRDDTEPLTKRQRVIKSLIIASGVLFTVAMLFYSYIVDWR